MLDDEVVRDRAGVQGFLALDAPGCVPGRSCSATLRLVAVSTTAPFVLGLRRRTVRLSDVVVLNVDPIPDELTPDPRRPDSLSRLLIPPDGARVYASSAISGEPERVGGALAIEQPIEGLIDWRSRRFQLFATLGEAEPDRTHVDFSLAGPLPNLLPVADAGLDQIVECASPDGTPVMLSAAASTDPDGDADLARFIWSADLGSGVQQVASGVSPTVVLPPGEMEAAVFVADRSGAGDVDGALVSIVDTTPPVFEDVGVATDCLWSPEHRMHLLRLGHEIVPTVVDACSGEVTDVRIVDAFSNQPADGDGDGTTAPDVRFGSGAACLRAERQGGNPAGRGYTIVLLATDATGNVSRHEVAIRVPHDQRPAARCATGDLAPEVPDDDARCIAPAPLPAAAAVAPVAPAPLRPSAAPPAAGCATTGKPGGFEVVALVLWLALRRRIRT